MNISSATTVCENWNSLSNNPSMMSFLGFESNSQRQFCEWETNTHNPSTPITTTLYNNNNYPFLNTPNTSFNCNNNMSSTSPTFVGHTTMSYPKLSDYSMAAEIIGLNLGGRTYFSSEESAVIDRLFKRPRGFYESNHAPRCQAEGCGIDLTLAKHYHRRHKVCEIHSKATKVVTGGLEQRFCQQCSRFHVLTEFDEGKRSCRKRLADHNRRRRKPPPPKVSEKATSEVVSSSGTKSEMKEKSLSLSSSCGIPKNSTDNSSTPCTSDINKDNNGFFLHAPYMMDREKERQPQQQPQHDMSYASATNHQRQEPIFNDLTTMSLFERGVLYPSSNATNLSMDCGGSDQIQHHQEDLQNLLHLGQALFEVDFSD